MHDDAARLNALARADAMSPEHMDKCLRCGTPKSLIPDAERGEYVCGTCGWTVPMGADSGPEWRNFEKDEGHSKERAGPPESLTRTGTSTIIGGTGRDASGKTLTPEMRAMVARERKWDARSPTSSMERNLRQALPELDRMADKLAVSKNVVEKAAYTYRKALERRLVYGRSISSIMAASLYAACRDTGTPRTLKDVAAISNVKKKDIARSYRLLLKEMDIKMPVVDPAKSVPRIASKLDLQERVKRDAYRIIKRAQETGVSAGKDPMGLAAAALYVACTLDGVDKTQNDIAEAAGVTQVTIRSRYRQLRKEILGLPLIEDLKTQGRDTATQSNAAQNEGAQTEEQLNGAARERDDVQQPNDSSRLHEIARASGIRYPITSYALSTIRRDEVIEMPQGMERDEWLGGALLSQYTDQKKIRENAERISRATKIPTEKLIAASATLKIKIRMREMGMA